MAGFFIYGPQALIGIASANHATKEASATANGLAGIFGYFGSFVSAIGIGIVAVGNLDIVSSIHNLVTRPIREFSNLTDIKLSWKTQPPLSPICSLFVAYAADYFAAANLL